MPKLVILPLNFGYMILAIYYPSLLDSIQGGITVVLSTKSNIKYTVKVSIGKTSYKYSDDLIFDIRGEAEIVLYN